MPVVCGHQRHQEDRRGRGAAELPAHGRRGHDTSIDHSDSEIAYVDAEYAHLFDGLVGELASLRHVIVFGGPAQDRDAQQRGADRLGIADQPADVGEAVGTGGTMIYTSGTTGKPKGAVRYATDMETGLALISLLGYRPDDIYITSGPLYHSGPGAFMGIGAAVRPDDRGAAEVRRRGLAAAGREVQGHVHVLRAGAGPDAVRAAGRRSRPKYDRSSMRVMIANAAPWSFALKQQYVADFPPESLWEVYGSTELGVDCVLKPEDQMRKPGSCGQPAPGIEIVLFDADGNVVTGTGPEHPGELFVRSKGVFNEYYKQQDSYDAASRGDFHTVGDIAYWDDEGYLYICDRKNDMIISGGMNIYPAEIEAALEQHPAIYDVAVFGIPSEEWGEVVHATVVLAPGASLTADEIKAFGKQHLASYKVPRSVDFIDELPRTGSGKILKRQLRAPYWAGRTAQVG